MSDEWKDHTNGVMYKTMSQNYFSSVKLSAYKETI